MSTAHATRAPYEGVLNIVRFNWPMFMTTAVVIVAGVAGASLLEESRLRLPLAVFVVALTMGAVIALKVSHDIYDRSDLYRFGWLARARGARPPQTAVFCQTGFDDCSESLRERTVGTHWTLLDHYDPSTMTEPSIRRARRRCPPASGTIAASYASWPMRDGTTDLVIAMLSVHELRHDQEREAWFAEARRVTRADGRVIVVEHVRDLANLAVFGSGALHFHSVPTWTRNWERSRLRLCETFRITPWVRVFVLEHA